jgi:hypothetical protein
MTRSCLFLAGAYDRWHRHPVDATIGAVLLHALGTCSINRGTRLLRLSEQKGTSANGPL